MKRLLHISVVLVLAANFSVARQSDEITPNDGLVVDGIQLPRVLDNYLRSAGRMEVLRIGGPLWTRHDRAGRPGAGLNSRSFSNNLKKYAKAASIESVHLHQTRHTYASIVAEETGSSVETQEALDHENAATTRVYVQRITVKN